MIKKPLIQENYIKDTFVEEFFKLGKSKSSQNHKINLIKGIKISNALYQKYKKKDKQDSSIAVINKYYTSFSNFLEKQRKFRHKPSWNDFSTTEFRLSLPEKSFIKFLYENE